LSEKGVVKKDRGGERGAKKEYWRGTIQTGNPAKPKKWQGPSPGVAHEKTLAQGKAEDMRVEA